MYNNNGLKMQMISILRKYLSFSNKYSDNHYYWVISNKRDEEYTIYIKYNFLHPTLLMKITQKMLWVIISTYGYNKARGYS